MGLCCGGSKLAAGMSDGVGICWDTCIDLSGRTKLRDAWGVRVSASAYGGTLGGEHVAASAAVPAASVGAVAAGSAAASITAVASTIVIDIECHGAQTVDDLVKGGVRRILYSSMLGELLFLALGMVCGRGSS